jgi:quinol monooxygenase YgiN
MSRVALIVSIEVRPEHLENFLAAIRENAERTFTDEPGCRYFDVTQDLDRPLAFAFYELYDDEAAIEAHRRTPHLSRWREAVRSYAVEGSQVVRVVRQIIHHG